MSRIPPIQCLLTFEALARLRSVTQAAEEQCVTPSAVSHRVRQLEELLGAKLFGRADFSLTTEGSEYLRMCAKGCSRCRDFRAAKRCRASGNCVWLSRQRSRARYLCLV